MSNVAICRVNGDNGRWNNRATKKKEEGESPIITASGFPRAFIFPLVSLVCANRVAPVNKVCRDHDRSVTTTIAPTNSSPSLSLSYCGRRSGRSRVIIDKRGPRKAATAVATTCR